MDDTFESDLRARMTPEQVQRRDALGKQWMALDREHFEVLMSHLDDEDSAASDDVIDVRRRLRAHEYAMRSLFQEVLGESVEVLEQARITALNHEVERSGYRISARPFLHTDRWWEPGYLDWDGIA
jgi:hypothetical protein